MLPLRTRKSVLTYPGYNDPGIGPDINGSSMTIKSTVVHSVEDHYKVTVPARDTIHVYSIL